MSLRVATYIAMAIGILMLLTYGMIYFTTQVSMDTSERRGEAGRQERVEADPEYGLSHRKEFHRLCQDFQAKNEQIELAEQSLTGTKRTETVYALEQSKADIASDYNTLANNYDSSQFREDGLPPELDPRDREVDCE